MFYVLAFAGDAVDGAVARRFNQGEFVIMMTGLELQLRHARGFFCSGAPKLFVVSCRLSHHAAGYGSLSPVR